jgi:hypothetical protein
MRCPIDINCQVHCLSAISDANCPGWFRTQPPHQVILSAHHYCSTSSPTACMPELLNQLGHRIPVALYIWEQPHLCRLLESRYAWLYTITLLVPVLQYHFNQFSISIISFFFLFYSFLHLLSLVFLFILTSLFIFSQNAHYIEKFIFPYSTFYFRLRYTNVRNTSYQYRYLLGNGCWLILFFYNLHTFFLQKCHLSLGRVRVF